MAVSKVKKLQLVAHARCRGEILTVLRRLGTVHISDVSEILPEAENAFPPFIDKTIEQVETRLARIRFCSDFLNKFVDKPSFLEALVTPKPIFTPEELESRLADFDTDHFHDQCKQNERELADIGGQIEKNETLAEDVGHWRDLDCAVEHIHDAETTRLTLGICELSAYEPMVEEISDATDLFHQEIIGRSRTAISMLMAYHTSAEDTVAPILRQYGWRAVRFPGLEGAPTEVLERLGELNKTLGERREELRERIIKDLVPKRDTLLLLLDHYAQELETLRIQHKFLFTSHTFRINGWVVAKGEEELRRQVEQTTDVVEIQCSDPGPDDEVPILLSNHRMVEPFALVTELYGRPQYTEFDPTPLLAPFFAVFFGICLGDGGYGLILIIGSLLALKKLPLQGGTKRLVQMLLASGIATTIFGVITGGIFGIEVVKLPSILQSLVIFNPTEDIIGFLYLAFAIGIFQMLFGIGVKVVHSVREGDITAAILEQGIWIFFIISIAPLGFKYLFAGEVGADIISLGSKGSVLTGIIIILFGARQQITFKVMRLCKHIGLGSLGDVQDTVDYVLSGILFFLGRLSLGILFFFKSLIDYFGDVLSYSRLMALGLATAFLGMVINQIATMALGIPYGVGLVLFVAILVFGHTFNLVINCLSAFVHTLRLQYLEFFSKFFVGGGVPFTPFAEERKYTSIQLGSGDSTSQANR